MFMVYCNTWIHVSAACAMPLDGYVFIVLHPLVRPSVAVYKVEF